MEIRFSGLSSFNQKSLLRLAFSKLKVILPVLGLLCFSHQILDAQVDYDPYHPEVQAAATRGVEFLAKDLSLDAGKAILAGIATIEHSKRYEETVPLDHPTVLHALEKANGSMERFPTNKSHYAPCLAIILYCSCDAEKYSREINTLLDAIKSRQNQDGGFGYWNQSATGDTSQTQYVALALWVAKAHGFDVPPEVGRDTLDWLCNMQQDSGSWYYLMNFIGGSYSPGGKLVFTHSIHCSGISTVYLLGDYLQLTPNGRKNQAANQLIGLDLPPSVSIYVPPKEGTTRKTGPLISFDRGKLGGVKARANKWLADNWQVDVDNWNYYYLYALERYAFFRETAEGQVKEIPTWYDQGVTYLFRVQNTDGSWGTGEGAQEEEYVNTAFAVMFLVRASEVLVSQGNDGTVKGNKGFTLDKPIRFENGTVTSQDAIKGVDDVMAILKSDGADEDLELVAEAMTAAIGEMAANDNKSRNEQVAFLRGMLAHKSFERRKIAVKLLAGIQDIDNAPALIYALGDPEREVRVEAHNGLRLISRKVDSIQLAVNANDADFAALKEQWSNWYLGVNPDGKLLD
ncbi:hypothetical protein OAG68_01985 [bacterium]|nr:hypothetical protein [bacterium]